MPNVGDYVNYGNQGVCRIDGRQSLKFGSAQPKRDYYILSPVYQKGSRVYVPADNQELLEKMRPVLSPQEIDKAIASVKEDDISWISDRKQRLAKSHEILARRDEHELLQLASCFYLKSRDGKQGLTHTDANILKKAESIIAQEFSFALNLGTEDIGAYIRQKLGLPETIPSDTCGYLSTSGGNLP